MGKAVIEDGVAVTEEETQGGDVGGVAAHIGDAVLGIGVSFPRYSSRTVKAMRYAHDRGATVIALTDSSDSPIAAYADHALLAKSDMISLVDTLVAPLSVVNALLVAVSQRREKELTRTFADLERIWDEYEVYEKVEN